METLLLQNSKNDLINQLKLLNSFLIYYNVITEIKIGNQFLPYINYNTLISDGNTNILINDSLLDYQILNTLKLRFNEVFFYIEEIKDDIISNNNEKDLTIINRKKDLLEFLTSNEKKGILYTKVRSQIRIQYPNKYNKLLNLYEYNFDSAIETNNRICLFKRGVKIKATTLAKQNKFDLVPNYYDNPTIYKIKKL